jgi:hypothetical protein
VTPRRWLLRSAPFAAAALYAGSIAACSQVDLKPLPTVGSDPGDAAIATPSFTRDIQPILSDRCAIPGCHIAPTQANLELVLKDADTSYANLVNVDSKEIPGLPRVAPGDSANSYLMIKLDDGEMPKLGPMLSQATRDTIRNWIDQGAARN